MCPFYHPFLTFISSKSLSSAILPYNLKYAIIKTVLIKANFSPQITDQSLFTHILLRFPTKLYKNICTNIILFKEQYSFIVNSSTEAAFCSVVSEISKVVNNRLSVGEILCDFDKIFDYVNRWNCR
jgi:uncharacterized protein YjfI (DUF2170 family)